MTDDNTTHGSTDIENASEKIIAGNGDLTNHSYY